jgi:D-alanyl-lipoteichoic acid acyltransferase DltB (MBOAT superfamily)
MGRQVAATRVDNNPGFAYCGLGLFLFIFGLFKKVFLADKLAPLIDVAFTPHLPLTFPEAWTAAIGYALQLYFDFSGYSDMAVGLGFLFGFKLPNNFLVPFRATSMIEYWKRWHITMTRFFTMYIYMPVALSMTRFARAKSIGPIGAFALTITVPTMMAFLASGLWHGAGWTFIMFGVANGVGLVINHIWKSANAPKLPRFLAWSLTAIMILITLVYFRSTSLAQAHSILHAMFIPHAFWAPPWLAAHLPQWHLPVTSYEWFAAAGTTISIFWLVAILAPLSVLLPAYSAQADKLKPTIWKAGATAAMLWLAFGVLDQPRSFIYFAF